MKVNELKSVKESQERWMSIPNSRLVVNPFDFACPIGTNQANYSNAMDIPLNIGYLDPLFAANDRGRMWDNVSNIMEAPDTDGEALKYIWKLDEEAYKSCDNYGTKAIFRNDEIEYSINHEHFYSCMTFETEIDFSLNPIVKIDVLKIIKGKWALKVSEGANTYVLMHDTDDTGSFHYDLTKRMNLQGKKNIKINLFATHENAKIIIGELSIICAGNGVIHGTCDYDTFWSPDRLGFKANYPLGLKVEGLDYFYDEKTVVRTVNYNVLPVISGNGVGKLSLKDDALTVEGATYKYAIYFSENGKFSFYEKYDDMLQGINALDNPSSSSTVWTFKPDADTGRIDMAFQFDYNNNKINMSSGNIAAGLEARSASWNDLMSRIPFLQSFELKKVPYKGITPEDIKDYYYTAWILMISGVLPENPEVGFNYKQVTCGKPSMWAAGEKRAAYSASWESFVGIIYMSYIDIDIAWSALTGLMYLVDETGLLGGESLPSMKAQTAWFLYKQSNDADKLKAIYTDLKRYLNWRIENPRWILGAHDYPNDKDLDFVANALIDIDITMKICKVIGMEEDIAEWKAKFDKLYEEFAFWFFDDERSVYEMYDIAKQKRGSKDSFWCYKALNIPGLRAKEADALLKSFYAKYKADKDFCGFSSVKYDSYQYPIYYFINNGINDIAENMIEKGIRDIVRTGFIGEVYGPGINCEGVRPSLFGAGILIENLMLMNGGKIHEN